MIPLCPVEFQSPPWERGLMEGAHRLTAGPSCSAGEKGTLAAIPGLRVINPRSLPPAIAPNGAMAKWSVRWAGGGAGTGVITPTEPLTLELPQKLGSTLAHVAGAWRALGLAVLSREDG